MAAWRRAAVFAVLGLLAARGIAAEVSLTLLYTADLHGHFEATAAGGDAALSGGLLRCAALIRALREQEPNLLLLDGGDLFQGTAAGYLDRGDTVMSAVRMLGYDALVPGNHEFDWGAANLLRLYRQGGIPVLAANLRPAAGGGRDAPPWQPFLIRELSGVRVAVVGLANPLTASWIRPRLLDGLEFQGSVAALRRILPAVRQQQPDVLVLAAHQGWRRWGDNPANEINAIARAFPEFDVILGAHSHQAVESAEVNGVLYVQPECHGRWLAKVSLRVDPARRRVTWRRSELLAAGPGVAPDPILARACAGALAGAREVLDREVGRAAADHEAASRYPGQSRVQALIARAIAEATGAEVVFHGALSEAALRRGRIRMRDLWRIVPYENTLAVAALTPDELREILEENSRFLKSEQFRGVYGIVYDLRPSRPEGDRVSRLRLADGREPEPDRRLRVAFNSHDLASAGGRFPRLREIAERPSSRLEETDLDTREAVLAYIRKHTPLDVPAEEGARLAKGK